ncbi:MAG TPA: hypothetical protein VN817_00895, partial [Solirubrobacteraceae bacterium]|nr:hypothetical protein [Solirubrobacteraceae bacterium]
GVSAVAAERELAPGHAPGPVANVPAGAASGPAAPADPAVGEPSPELAQAPPPPPAQPGAAVRPDRPAGSDTAVPATTAVQSHAAVQPEAATEISVAAIATVPERAERQAGSAEREQLHQQSAEAASVAEGLAPLLAWWPAVVELVRGDNALLGACIEEARPVEVTGEDLTVAFSATAPFLKKKAENPENRAAVTAALRDVTGRRWRLSYELHEGLELDDGELSEEEWLKRFIEEFDAEELPGDEAHSSEQKGA